MAPALAIRDLRAGYGPITVLWGVSLAVGEGRTVAIVGPNGAGKTTLLRAVMGVVPTSQGTVESRGRTLTGTPTWDVVESGVVMIPEGRLVFADMSVEDNLRMGAYPRGARDGWRPRLERVFGLFPRLAERRRQLAGSLSGGEAQMLALGRGLMENPKVLLVDEPSLGLAPVVVDEIFRTLAALKGEGLSIILVEQNTHRAVALADEVHLMRSGVIAYSAPAADVDLAHLHALYFAKDAAEAV
ncbi:MAG TPA: ABC transporter ATP-binding protein [Beijerinckiaceae bacterium]|jgi:branched-chain amino acid transport system ATP-binding protein